MKSFPLLIKPASADCNLRCGYCYYLDRQSLYPHQAKHRMTEATLTQLISGYMGTSQPQYVFVWQGGEPTLMGLDFFKTATRLQQQYGKAGDSVANSFQTNGLLIDDRMASFFAAHHFLVGISLDGPPDIHNVFRISTGRKGSHDKVLRAIDILRRNGVRFNVLTVVSQANVDRLDEIYAFFKTNDLLHLQFIPYLDRSGTGSPGPGPISGNQWGKFLCALFDRWWSGDREKISIRLFDDLLDFLISGKRNVCHMQRNCRQYFVVEYNGDVYPCDFFVSPEYKLGNIITDSWEMLANSKSYGKFGREKSVWNPKCEDCGFLVYCQGDCVAHRRFDRNREGRRLSGLCEGWRMFFNHCLPNLKRLSNQLRLDNPALTMPKIGRNSLCPCGSEKKFKKCCLQK